MSPNNLSCKTGKSQNRKSQNGMSPNNLSCKTGKSQNGKSQNRMSPNNLSCKAGKSQNGMSPNNLSCKTGMSQNGISPNSLRCSIKRRVCIVTFHKLLCKANHTREQTGPFNSTSNVCFLESPRAVKDACIRSPTLWPRLQRVWCKAYVCIPDLSGHEAGG